MRAIALICCLQALAACAQCSLDVEVKLNRAPKGTLRMVICPSEAAFTSEKGCTAKEVGATSATMHVPFPQLVPGTYAVKVFHDENNNNELDVNWMGIPKEPYGFSNDAMGTFGPPSFQQAAFEVKPGTNTTRLRMKG